MKECLLAAGGVVGAIGASTCCVAPLAFVSVGVSGVWIANLTALAAYQPLFFAVAVLCLGSGFYLVYRRKTVAGEANSCAGPKYGGIISVIVLVKGALWLGASLVALSIGLDYGSLLLL